MARSASPVLRTWTAGEEALGQYQNSLRDALAFLLAPPQVQVTSTVSQNITSGATGSSGNAIAFDTEIVDSDGMHSTTTNTTRLTCVVPGWYDLTGAVGFAANSAGRRGGAYAVNGSVVTGTQELFYAGGGGASGCTLPLRRWRQYFNAGDYVEQWAIQDSGSTLATVTGVNDTSFTMTWASQ